MRAYTLKTVLAVTGITKPSATAWAAKGILVPDFGHEGGTGNHRRFSFGNLFEACLARELARWGLPGATIRDVVRDVRAEDRGPWRTHRNVNTRESGERAMLLLVPHEPDAEGKAYSGAFEFLEFGELGKRAKLAPGYYSAITIELTAILEHVEGQTQDCWSDVE